jgi:hypothetical protein
LTSPLTSPDLTLPALATLPPEHNTPTPTFTPTFAHDLDRHDPNIHSPTSQLRQHTLRRSPNFDRAVRFADVAPQLVEPHPALRVSRRTAEAIRFVLEEALRVPYPFTPDTPEENAAMSDLTAQRPANGARANPGPVPVTQADRSNIRTPQMIMNERRQREAARRQQSEADELRKQDEERRKSVERRAQAVAGVAATQSAAHGSPLRPVNQYDQQPPAGGAPPQPERMLPTMSQPPDATAGAQYARPRANSQSQQQPRAAQPPATSAAAPTAESRRPPPAQHARRPSGNAPPPSAAAQQRAPPPASSVTTQPRDSTVSNFPHAFERWETLSSHWEGLTSYWIRRLEQNTDEVRREPLAQQMSRQITDLSAAGANLFHAVVELQRLRASSERKFQRWFHEHRQDQEKAQEREAQFEQTLKTERDARIAMETDLERLTTEKKNAERAVIEMKRELQISKEEARRAWEELGRREQEERDRTFSLREGQPTVVGGVQVLPMTPGMGSDRPQSDDMYSGIQDGRDIEQHYSYEDPQSPTDTDPFTESTRHGHREQDIPSLASGLYVPSGAAARGSTASSQPQMPSPLQPQRATTSQSQAPVQPTSRPEDFYQQPESYLHGERPTSSQPDDTRSYVPSSVDEDEYALDSRGRYILDDAGHRVPLRSLQSPMSDEYDVTEDRRRELAHLQHYGTATASPGRYATTGGGHGYTPQDDVDDDGEEEEMHGHGYAAAAARPDYSGDGYGDEWIGMRHHHPTRLSDVPEEDERSRASPSRASQTSRGRF